MSVKINKLELENVKRVRAVALTPTANGLTVIGGRMLMVSRWHPRLISVKTSEN